MVTKNSEVFPIPPSGGFGVEAVDGPGLLETLTSCLGCQLDNFRSTCRGAAT